MTEQQKARIVDLAKRCENNLTWAHAHPRFASYRLRMAEQRSAEAFRIAQETRR